MILFEENICCKIAYISYILYILSIYKLSLLFAFQNNRRLTVDIFCLKLRKKLKKQKKIRKAICINSNNINLMSMQTTFLQLTVVMNRHSQMKVSTIKRTYFFMFDKLCYPCKTIINK